MIFDGAKLAMVAGAAIVVSMLAYKAYDAIGDARETKITKAWQAKYDKLAAESRAKEQKQRDDLQAASQRYEDLRESVRNDPTPVPIVRLSKCPSRPSVPSTAATAGQPVEAPANGLDRENGPTRAEIEFSHGLREYAQDCKLVAGQLIEVIGSWPR